MNSPKIQFRSSLRWRFSFFFVVIVVISSALQVFLSTRGWRTLLEETEQQIHWNLAADLAEQIQPVLINNLEKKQIEEILYRYTISNPKMEFVLLDAKGNILHALPTFSTPGNTPIDLQPIEKALRPDTPVLPLYGDNPFDSGNKTIFSVAQVSIAGQKAYLYIPLMSATYEFFIRNTGQFYLIRTIVSGILLSWVVAFISGSILLWFLGRRFNPLSLAMERFQQGDFSARAPIAREDELGRVSETFNKMADTIAHNTKELENKDRIRRELIANISHDLRGPVTSMLAHLEALREKKLTPQETEEYLSIVTENADSQRELVEDLFGLASLEANEAKPDKDLCSLFPILRSVVSSLKPAAEKKSLSLELEVPDNLPLLFADSRMIQRVFLNLVSNSLRYTPAGGWVRVRARAEGNTILVEVSDSGIGIPEDDLPHIFESFFRANKGRPEDPGGTGLGLAIVKKLLELHESVPRVRSEVDKGTTFEVPLPCSSEELPRDA